MPVDVADPAIQPGLVQQHLERIAAALTQHGADGVIVFRKTNILAFTGVPLEPSDRLVCAFINTDGRIAFVVPAFEADQAGRLPPGSEIVTWQEHDDPYVAARIAAERIGLSKATILVDGHTWLDARDRLQACMAGAKLVRDPGVLDGIRIIKSDEEISAIRAACDDTGKIYSLVRQHLRPGITERELSREVIDQLMRMGVTPHGDLIQGGPSASVPHQPTGHRRFVNGDAVIVDFVARRLGYHGDMTRTFSVGAISDEIVSAYSVVREAQAAAIAAIKPGVTCEEVDRVARDVIEGEGLGDYFTHRLGHGIGLDVHEPPYLVQGNRQKLEAGMCVTVEPGVYVPDRFGIRIEDVIAVTESGCEVLSASVPTDLSDSFR